MIYVIGASNIDFGVKAKQRIVEGESNLASISVDFGGVARNIAENLSILDCELSFITALGNDLLANILKQDLSSKLINYDLSVDISENQSTYLSVLRNDGELYNGYNDMSILDKVNIEQLEAFFHELKSNDIVVMDCNFPIHILKSIAKKVTQTLVVDGTSAIKCQKLLGYLQEIDLLKLNKNEAESLSAVSINNEDNFIEAFKLLRLKGVNDCIISYPEGLYYLKGCCVYSYKHNMSLNVVNVTGAGDALISGIVNGIYQRQDFDYVVQFGLALASITLQSPTAIANYDIDQVNHVIMNSNIKGEKIYEFKN